MALVNPLTTRRAQRGFTLMELLVSMSVFILMVGMLAQVLSSAQTGLSYLGNSALRRQDASTVLSSIARDLRASLQPMNQSYEGADAATGQFQLLINPAGVGSASGLCNPNTIFWSASVPSSTGGAGLVGYVVRWTTTPAGTPQPILCRMFLNTTQAAPQLAQAQSGSAPLTQWASSSLITTYAPADLNDGYQGWLADNVLALYVRALDPNMMPITKYARAVTGMTAAGNTVGGLNINLNSTTGASSVNQFDSRQGYQYASTTTPTTTTDVFGPAKPAAIEIVIVAAELRDIIHLPTPLPPSVLASTGYNASADMWTNVNAYMAGLPASLRKSARAYSTIVTP